MSPSAIVNFLTEQVVDQRKAVSITHLLLKLNLAIGQYELVERTILENFFSSSNADQVVCWATRPGANGNSIVLGPLTSEEAGSLGNGKVRLHSIRPVNSPESSFSICRRERELVRDRLANNIDLFDQISLIEPVPCDRREIASTIKPVPAQGVKLEPAKQSGPAQRMDLRETVEPPKQPVATHSSNQQSAGVPSNKSIEAAAQSMVVPELVSVAESVLQPSSLANETESAESSASKKIRVEEPTDDVVMRDADEHAGPPISIASSVASSGFREVVIKRKVVVTEYEMGPNGEMLVRDVEKMTEEVVQEPIVRSSEPVRRAAQPVVPKKAAAAPKPGQPRLTDFFARH